MPIYVSTLLATYNSLWVGTENGVVVTFSFGSPVVVSEESDWEVLKVSGKEMSGVGLACVMEGVKIG